MKAHQARWLRAAWLVTNIIGLIAYLTLASGAWIEPELRGYPGASVGDSIVWGLTALPVLLGFFLLDFTWVCLEIYAGLKRRTGLPLAYIGFVLVAWLAAVVVDYAHH